MVRTSRRAAAAMAAVLSLAGCTGVAPTIAPATTGPEFTLTVIPDRFVGRAIGGQLVIFLVTISGQAADGTATIAADAGGARVEIRPAQLLPGEVGEVTVVPSAVTGEREMAVTITATRGTLTRTSERTFTVAEGTDFEGATARAYLTRFTTWLAANRPDLGITPATTWQGTPGSWVLVVTHYVFLSESWELDMAWHVMTAPDDWIRINLRRRGTETAPSVAFEIPSAAGTGLPREIPPEEAVWR